MTRPRLSAALLEQVGWTGLLIAGIRAEESRRSDALIDDPFATMLVDLVGDEGDERTRWTMRDGQVSELGAALGDYIGVRTRYIDDAVVAATAAGIRQVVLLGAGLDSRSYRMAWPEDTTVFEVDTPEVLEAKEHLAGLCGLAVRTERRAVATDLRDDWATVLATHGHRVDAPTLWVIEGLLYYFSRPQGDLLMAAVASRTGAGGQVVTEYPDVDMASFFTMVGSAPGTQHAAGFVQTGPEEAPHTWLPRFGWQDVSAAPLADLLARHSRPVPAWATRNDGATWWLASAYRG
jgi:methyltransferase (TIGR00027 family)